MLLNHTQNIMTKFDCYIVEHPVYVYKRKEMRARTRLRISARARVQRDVPSICSYTDETAERMLVEQRGIEEEG